MITSEFLRAFRPGRSGAAVRRCLAAAVLGSALGFVFIGTLPAHTAGAGGSGIPPGGEVRPVLIELFTSEGCSSCPPADAFLKQLDEAGEADGVKIIAMEEHVDYWDELGWRDPFSSHKWTERQENYARGLANGAIYTPQLVINGSSEIVGSAAGQARQKIAEAAKTEGASLHLSATRGADRNLEFAVTMENVPAGAGHAQLLLAVTERGLRSNVLRGENGGRSLAHAAVLRSLSQVKFRKENSARPIAARGTISLDPSWRSEQLQFVAILQDPRTLGVLGAAAFTLPR